MSKGFDISVGLGRRDRLNGTNYTAYNGGVSKAFGKRLSVDVRYYSNDHTSNGDAYKHRVVGLLKLTF